VDVRAVRHVGRGQSLRSLGLGYEKQLIALEGQTYAAVDNGSSSVACGDVPHDLRVCGLELPLIEAALATDQCIRNGLENPVVDICGRIQAPNIRPTGRLPQGIRARMEPLGSVGTGKWAKKGTA